MGGRVCRAGGSLGNHSRNDDNHRRRRRRGRCTHRLQGRSCRRRRSGDPGQQYSRNAHRATASQRGAGYDGLGRATRHRRAVLVGTRAARGVFEEPDAGLDRRWQQRHCAHLSRLGAHGSTGSWDVSGVFEVIIHLQHRPPKHLHEVMVRFAHGPLGDNIGFHEIPRKDGAPIESDAQLGLPLSGGCVRQSTADAMFMWDFAGIGTTVVVTD